MIRSLAVFRFPGKTHLKRIKTALTDPVELFCLRIVTTIPFRIVAASRCVGDRLPTENAMLVVIRAFSVECFQFKFFAVQHLPISVIVEQTPVGLIGCHICLLFVILFCLIVSQEYSAVKPGRPPHVRAAERRRRDLFGKVANVLTALCKSCIMSVAIAKGNQTNVAAPYRERAKTSGIL